MECYIDESGNTGCVTTNKSGLNYKESPVFTLGMVTAKDKADKEELLAKYNSFKAKNGIVNEIKGSDLCTKRFNKELLEFIDNVLDNDHFLLNLYDKKFYISTLLLTGMVGLEFKDEYIAEFYYHATELSLQSDTFFIRYDQYISEMTVESFHEYLVFLRDYRYEGIDEKDNLIRLAAISILEKGDEEVFYDDFLHYGSYVSRNITNLINLNALSEAIYFCKEKNEISNGELVLIHDNQQQFESVFKKELSPYEIKLLFADSKKEGLIQLADNLCSIMGHFYRKMISHLKKGDEWHENSYWDMNIFSKLLTKISINNVKYTIPLVDWAAALCVAEMFQDGYPKELRNRFVFNAKYAEYQMRLYQDLSNNNYRIDYVLNKLKK